VKTSCGRFPPKEGCLRLNHSIAPWVVVKVVVSLRKVCGGLRVRLGLRFQKVRFKNNDFKMCDFKK
jgi:hypothetical protein